jgi:molybdenum cofactor cytidylyltransferase
VLLAAGLSQRMGHNKMLLEVGGESILRRAAGQALGAGLDPLLVVLGHEADRARAELAGLPCRPVVNPDYARGVNASLRAGMAQVPAETDAVVVMLADMPFVTDEMIRTLVQRYRAGTAPLVISDYAGVPAPPMLYDRSLFPELETVEGEGCGRQVVRRHRHEAVAVSWPREALADVDVPEDYERAKAAIADAERGRESS